MIISFLAILAIDIIIIGLSILLLTFLSIDARINYQVILIAVSDKSLSRFLTLFVVEFVKVQFIPYCRGYLFCANSYRESEKGTLA